MIGCPPEDLIELIDISPTPPPGEWGTIFDDGSVLVDISSKSKPGQFMRVDRIAADRYCQEQKWTADNNGYAVAKVAGKKVSFHRLIVQAPDGVLIDHINRDRLDNRICNLRFASRELNSHNREKMQGASSQYVGVCWSEEKGRWRSGIRMHGALYHIGYFENEVTAAKAYDTYAIQLYGGDASLNFPQFAEESAL